MEIFDQSFLEKVLGRKIYQNLIKDADNLDFSESRILITGANGSIGTQLVKRFKAKKVNFVATDIETLDVTNPDTFLKENFTHVVNIAGAKHAPLGEKETQNTFDINTNGTLNLLKFYPNAKHILCSTCKSCNPETVYGASKLIAERLVINNGGSIARFYNVIETSGNVFEIWNNQEGAIDVVSECHRYFITLDEAVSLLMFSIKFEGRLMVNVPSIRNMLEIANSIHPGREKRIISPRRGDRLNEKRYADHEFISSQKIHDNLIRVCSPND